MVPDSKMGVLVEVYRLLVKWYIILNILIRLHTDDDGL